MPAEAMGPTYAGGTQPDQIPTARQNGPDSGDYPFNLVRFAGTGGAER